MKRYELGNLLAMTAEICRMTTNQIVTGDRVPPTNLEAAHGIFFYVAHEIHGYSWNDIDQFFEPLKRTAIRDSGRAFAKRNALPLKPSPYHHQPNGTPQQST